MQSKTSPIHVCPTITCALQTILTASMLRLVIGREYDERKQQSSAVNKQNKPDVSNLTPEEAKQTMLLKIKHAKLYETKY